MGDVKITQENFKSIGTNADAQVKATQEYFDSIGTNADAQVKATQEYFDSIGANANTLVKASQIYFLTITNVPADPDACSPPWVIPTPAEFPLPSNGGPRPAIFQEVEGDWGAVKTKFKDGKPQARAIQTAPIRQFEVEFDGLSEAEAAALDAHWDSTRGGLKFTVVHYETAEVITGVRYEKYEHSGQRKKWAQGRSIRLIKYTS